MPLPPPEKPAVDRSANPARIMLSSPLAAATRARVFHQRTRQRPRERGLRILAIAGALVLHLLFLFGFVLGPAYQPKPPHETKGPLLQIRLIEPPEPPPPPPVRGTPPKERGPRHQGRRSRVATTEVSANVQPAAAVPTLKPAPPVPVTPAKPAKPAKPIAAVAKPVAAPKPPVSVPKPAPTPELQPVPLASEPPAIQLPTPVLQPPVPPKFQPESARQAQREGNQYMPPPPSLAMPEVPREAAPPVALSSIALNAEIPKTSRPAGITVAPAQLSAAPPVPALQPVPLPAQSSPSITLQSQVTAPAPVAPQQQPRIQAPTVDVSDAEWEAVPITPAEAIDAQPAAPKVELMVSDTAPKQTLAPTIAPAQLSPSEDQAEPSPAQPETASELAKSASQTTAQQPAAPESTPAPGDLSTGHDVSTAPDATPQGDDTAPPGEPDGVVASESQNSASNRTAPPLAGQAGQNGDKGKDTKQGAGQPGGNQPGADQGEKNGAAGGYVQLKPHGDTDIMSHGTANIGYKATRFEDDWAPKGESSIDTALRHAVEKTTVGHTFHLPRGVRIKCDVSPLLPIKLFGCHNPDPPPKPVKAEVYKRLNLAPAAPLAAPESPATVASPAAMVPADNSAECSIARVSGAPPPPGCQSLTLPVKLAPASSSSSWVPAGDQFH